MKKIDVLLINDNCDIIKLPESVHNIDDMLRFVNENMDKYVKMFEINHHDCVEPFLIEFILFILATFVQMKNTHEIKYYRKMR